LTCDLSFVRRNLPRLACFALIFIAQRALAQDAAACLDCHEDKKIYQQSVHKDMQCADCHQGFKEFPHSEPVAPARAPMTCGQCHTTEFEQYQRSVHGVAHAQGKSGVPVCTDCHGIHSIEHPDQSAKSGAENALGRAMCSRCHASEVLAREYALPLDRVRTYLDSYHGLASRRGSPAVANCASCHGVHEILASTNPASSIHPAKLPATCGKCHPGATANFARGPVHQAPERRQGILHYVSVFYITLILVVIGGMLVHNVFDFRAKLHGVGSSHAEGFFVRGEVIQHWLLLASFTVLTFSGFALKWPDSVFGLLVPVSEQLRRWIHRSAGVVMLALALYHVIALIATKRGRDFVARFRPRFSDVKGGVLNALFNVRMRGTQPVLGYPSYIEKIEYWALIWGTLIMGVTGLMLWFENITLRLFPLWIMNVLTLIHYYEALLATLAILVWHIYFVVLDPTIYPLKSRKHVRSLNQ
jgi:cytochrome b subunit of formate dehydrogenase